jgi:excisionase family DNA binding protein
MPRRGTQEENHDNPITRNVLHPRLVHKDTMTPPAQDTIARWATKEEVAQHLRVSIKTVTRMTSRGELTAHNLGPRLKRYDLNAIDAAMQANDTQEVG